MSHFSKINAKVQDEQALSEATKKMGFELIFQGQCRYYYGIQSADLVVKLPGKYDIALNKEGDSYRLQADLFGNNVEKYVGPDAGLLMQRYSVEKAKIEAFKKALAVTETTKGNDIVVTTTDYETGGQVEIICHIGGKIEVKTSGFPGSSCMKFKDLEAALGSQEEFTPTMEFYAAEPNSETEEIKTII